MSKKKKRTKKLKAEVVRETAPAKQRQYNAAKTVNATSALHVGAVKRTADSILAQYGDKLDAVARNLIRNNMSAGAIVDNLARKIVGKNGLIPQVRTENNTLNEQIERAFARWARNCTLPKHGAKGLTWARLNKLWVREISATGEALAYRAIEPGTGRMVIVPFEPEQLATGVFETFGRNKEDQMVSRGVKYDKLGRPVAYLVSKAEPGSTGALFALGEYEEVPVDRIVHIMDVQRPTQWRGETKFASTSIPIFDEDDARFAELQGMRAAAYFGLYAIEPEAGTPEDIIGGMGGAETTDSTATAKDWEINVSPGTFNVMPYGSEFGILDAKRPGNQFGPFVDAVIMRISARWGIPYHAVSGDVSKANYSSLRAAMLETRDTYEDGQSLLIEHGCEPAFAGWLQWAVQTGEVRLTRGLTVDDILEATDWQRPGWPYVDPHKEAQADQMALDLGIKTWDQLCGEKGLDGREQRQRIKRARELDEEYDVETPGVGSMAKAMATAKPKESGEDEKPEDETEAEAKEPATEEGVA